MSAPAITGDALLRALSLRDLSNPSPGQHAMQLLLTHVTDALVRAWGATLTLHRAHAVVSVDDNYDALSYERDGVARDARYTRYVSEQSVLRTQTSAMLPPLLRARAPHGMVDDELLACPGLVYRRDCIDRLHVGEPHQLDLWRLKRGQPGDLDEMIALVVGALLPGRRWRAVEAAHPYTTGGRQIDVDVDGRWIEVGECGLAHPAVLARAGIDPERVTGLAMGLGLDRVLMIRKGIDDIRLLRASDARVSGQMLDLEPYRPVSRMPAMVRDLSIVVAEDRTLEEIGERTRAALGDDANAIEDIELVADTPWSALPEKARARLALEEGERNVLLRVHLRPLDRTLTDDEGNALRDRVYAAVHEGRVNEWARR